MTLLPDRIECAIRVDAPVERVWAVMTEARHVARWYAFGGAEIDLSPFGRLVFRWSEHGAFHGQLATIEPPYALSFLFACLAPDEPVRLGNSTLVEFTMEPGGRETRARVAECGFARLDAPDRMKTALAASSRQAWADGLALMRTIAEQPMPQRRQA